jgi:WhiB family redox-sensing transcriptional regulator
MSKAMSKRTEPTIRPFKMTNAEHRFHLALVDLAHDNRGPRCVDSTDSDLWTSEDAADREQACALCTGCEVRRLCGAAASSRREPWGVWAGKDRGEPQRGRPRLNSGA